ncbi:MAG TPA: hypothetical protein VL172_06820, partial [Kofleriaceae bacterium]|nr:hypothetical protein [Kofleriaceae bacterium]
VGGDTFVVGDFSSVFVEMHRYVGGDYEGVGTNSGTLSITAVTDASVSGSLAFDYTDDQSRHFTADGTFEVVNCVP